MQTNQYIQLESNVVSFNNQKVLLEVIFYHFDLMCTYLMGHVKLQRHPLCLYFFFYCLFWLGFQWQALELFGKNVWRVERWLVHDCTSNITNWSECGNVTFLNHNRHKWNGIPWVKSSPSYFCHVGSFATLDSIKVFIAHKCSPRFSKISTNDQMKHCKSYFLTIWFAKAFVCHSINTTLLNAF